MNKKLATLLFAIGLGVASASASAGTCQNWCQYFKAQCLADPSRTADDCSDEFLGCMDYCDTTFE